MWLLLNESQTESQAMGEAVVGPIDAPAATGQPPPLPEADAVVMEEPVATGQPPPLPSRRAGSRQPVSDNSGQPCVCG